MRWTRDCMESIDSDAPTPSRSSRPHRSPSTPNAGQIRPVQNVSLSIFPGQTVAIVGESGCGKSVTSLSILRLIPQPPGKFLAARFCSQGRDLLQLSEARNAGRARQRNRDDLSGADDLAQSGLHNRRPDRRGHHVSSGRVDRDEAYEIAEERCTMWASPTRTAESTNIRTRCPAACGSG